MILQGAQSIAAKNNHSLSQALFITFPDIGLDASKMDLH